MEPNFDSQIQTKAGSEPPLVNNEIKSIRKRYKITQREVAVVVGVTASMVSKIERGLANPSPEVAERLENWELDVLKESLLSEPDTKRCWKCKFHLPITSFGIDNTRSSGRQSKCLNCNVNSVSTWRQANWKRFLLKKQVKRKVDSSAKRIAGHQWISDEKRTRKELVQLGETGTLHICSLRGKPSQRSEAGVKNYMDEYGGRIRKKYELGEISETQARRLATLTAKRPPHSFDFDN